MYSAIIFDLDGTLIDSYPGILQSLNETLRHLGSPAVDLPTVKRMVGRGVENLMQQAAGERWQEALKFFRQSYDRTHLSGSTLMPDVIQTLRLLREHGTRLAVASNKPPKYTRNILRHLQIDDFFQDVCGPDGSIKPKPDASMLTHVMKNLGVQDEQTLYVGDMALDAETAHNAHVAVALIPGGGASLEELQAAYPDYLLSHFSDLLSLPIS
jgi:phosphoglycolate phosphatase